MEVNITSVGMVSSLGLDWATSSAAARCGVSRASELPQYRLQAGDPVDVRLVQGHEVSLLTSGFEGKGRLLRLFAGALRNLREHASIAEQLPLYLALPSDRRTESNRSFVPEKSDQSTEQARDDSDDLGEAEESEELDLDDFISHAARLAQWIVPPCLRAQSRDGGAGFAELIRLCGDEIDSSRPGRALIGAVDSLLDDETLVWLHKIGRLKHAAAPTGLMPGEAAVVFLVDRDTAGRSIGTFSATAAAREVQSLTSGSLSHGAALAEVITTAGNKIDWPSTSQPWIVSDFNGETYSAHEWGCTMHRLLRTNPIFGEVTTTFPAASFGDTGSAAMAVGIASAIAAWTRGYASDSRCCVTASSDEGARAAAILSTSETRR